MVATFTNRIGKYFGRMIPWRKPSKRELLARAHRNQAVRLLARYDSAATNSENAEHWSHADDLSASAANSYHVRRMIRRRARYEAANNCYCAGMLLTLANDLVGSGPRLRMSLKSEKANRRIERAFAAWLRDIGFAQKLRTAVITKKRDGEVFFRFYTNPNHTNVPVWLDVEILEGDQVTTPTLVPSQFCVDGITYDEFQQPSTYQILHQHPGSEYAIDSWVPDDVPACDVIHWFRIDRPGQRRGISEIGPALPLYSQLRRFTLSVLTASETAADHAAILESTAATAEDTDGDLSALNPLDDVAYTRGMLTAVPYGWKLNQLRAEQPTTTYGMFKGELLNEIARVLLMPFNIAAGNSAGYNYSSGRLDHKGYYGAISIEQCEAELVILDRLFRAWYAEARLIYLEDGSRYVPDVDLTDHPWSYAWDPPADIDPVKTSQARQVDLACGATTLAKVYADQGLELDVALDEQAATLGLTRDELNKLVVQSIYGSAASVTPAPNDQELQARRRKKKRARTLASKARAWIGGRA